jgi:hypothetical protein
MQQSMAAPEKASTAHSNTASQEQKRMEDEAKETIAIF